jgi:hypothetical protein
VCLISSSVRGRDSLPNAVDVFHEIEDYNDTHDVCVAFVVRVGRVAVVAPAVTVPGIHNITFNKKPSFNRFH